MINHGVQSASYPYTIQRSVSLTFKIDELIKEEQTMNVTRKVHTVIGELDLQLQSIKKRLRIHLFGIWGWLDVVDGECVKFGRGVSVTGQSKLYNLYLTFSSKISPFFVIVRSHFHISLSACIS